VLEINPKHPLVERLNRHQDDPRLADWASVLFNQAVLTLGARIDDPAGFVTRLNDLLTTLTDEPVSDGREVDADDGGTAAADDG
jgi:molecular chaperone HtpG